MTATVQAGLNPYVGPRAFQPGETLYGRDREVLELLGLILAERIVLLHSPSGAGKTSLIQAALIPRLEQEGFEVLPVIRVSLEPPAGTDPGAGFNRYVLSVLMSLEEGVPAGEQLDGAALAGMSLDRYLSQRPAEADNQVLIFDQFEEVLLDPADQIAKREFFDQVGAALRHRERWALFAMRDDYVAALDPYLRALPTRARTRFRLDFLSQQAARQAVQRPAEEAGITFSEGAVSKLIDDLRQVWVQQPDGSSQPRPGPYVEPVQLQVVCLRLWDRLGPEQKEIGESDIEGAGEVDMALSMYYAQQVADVARRSGVSERLIRDWFDLQLIVEQRFRGQAREGPQGGIDGSRSVLRRLEDAHLIRAEQRRGTTWYELAHDRLVAPVQADNARWRQEHLHALQRQAAIWDDEDRPEGLLLGGRELAEGEAWAAEHAAELTKLDREFLDACRQARARAGRKRLYTRILFALAAAAVMLACVAVYFGIETGRQAEKAERQARISASGELVAAALANLDADPQTSVKQALSALNRHPEGMTESIRDILYRSVDASRVRATLTDRAAEPEGFSDVALSSDGTRLVAGTWTDQAVVWELPARRKLFPLPDGEGGWAVALEGKRIATAGSHGAKIWDADSGELVTPLHSDGEVIDLAFGPGAKRLVTGGLNGVINVWDVASERIVRTIRARDDVQGIALDRDGRRLATAGLDGTAQVWDMSNGRQVRRVHAHTHEIMAVAFSPHGTLLATASLDGTAKIWSVRTGRLLATLSGHTNSVFWVGFTPDGERVGTASADGTARVWDTQSGTLLLTLLGHTTPINGAAFGPDGTMLVTASWEGTVKVWDATTAHTGFVYDVAFDRHSELVATASADKAVKLWKATSSPAMTCAQKAAGTPEAWSQARPSLRGHTEEVVKVTFSPDGKLVATASGDGTAKLWNVASGRMVRTYVGHSDLLNDVAFNSNGTLLATASGDGTARLWNVASGRMVRSFTGHSGQVFAVAFNAEGTLLATASADRTVKIWNVESAQEVKTLADHTDSVYMVAFSPKRGSTLLATTSLDKTVRLWDLRTDEPRLLGPKRVNPVGVVAFSPNSDLLATAGWDGTAQIWEVASGKRLLTISHSAKVNDMAFSPNGKLLATATSDRRFHVYDLNPQNLLAVAHCRAAAG